VSAGAAGLTLYFAPLTRAVRIVWLLEELGLPHRLERVEFVPPTTTFFAQRTPTGKVPTLVDGDVVLCESGAILEYVLERYGQGRLAPPPGSPERARFLQWVHFAESTAFPPLGILVWIARYRDEAEPYAPLLADTRERAASGFAFLERGLGDGAYLLGDEFSGADIMMGFTLAAARALGALDARHPRVQAYLERLEARPAYQKAVALR
jgi:glutathione S-transferase